MGATRHAVAPTPDRLVDPQRESVHTASVNRAVAASTLSYLSTNKAFCIRKLLQSRGGQVGFEYSHLDEKDVRAAMVSCWEEEWASLGAIAGPMRPYGKQLTPIGWDAFADAMPDALATHDDDWLREQMSNPSYWDTHLTRKTKQGVKLVDYNKADAIQKLCYGEFNIAYIRGLATALLGRGETVCVVYRADSAYVPRGECSEWEEKQFTLQEVIDGHRARYWPPDEGDRSVFSVPSGPNCHHSIKAVGA